MEASRKESCLNINNLSHDAKEKAINMRDTLYLKRLEPSCIYVQEKTKPTNNFTEQIIFEGDFIRSRV